MAESPGAARLYRRVLEALRGAGSIHERIAVAGRLMSQLGQLDLMPSGAWREHVDLLSGWRRWARLSPRRAGLVFDRIKRFADRMQPPIQTAVGRSAP